MSERPVTSIVPAKGIHAEALSSLRAEFWRDQKSSGLLEATPDCGPAVTLQLIGRARTHVLVAERADTTLSGYVFGQTKLVPGDPVARVSSIEEVYVREDARGEGIAARLAQVAFDAFRADGANRIQLRVLQRNAGGAAFWQKLGLEPYLTVYELPLSS